MNLAPIDYSPELRVNVVIPMAYRTHVADQIVQAWTAQSMPIKLIVVAQTPEAIEYAQRTGLEWHRGRTGRCGDRHILAANYHEQPDYWVYSDDDAIPGPNFIRRSLRNRRHEGVLGWWAWHLRPKNGEYYHYRRKRAKPGQRADHLGACGAIVTSAQALAIGECPEYCGYVDDIWMSGQCHRLGLPLEATVGQLTFHPVCEDENALVRTSKDKDLWTRELLVPHLRR